MFASQEAYAYYTNMSIQTDQVRSRLEWLSTLSAGPEPSEETKYLRKTSIIATIGPKVNNVEMLGQLRKAGMNVVRMNFSHGSYEYHQSVIDNVHKLVELEPEGRPLAIALDTKGPEIRTGLMRPGCDDVKIPAGHEFIVTVDPQYAELCDDKRLFMDYRNLPAVTAPGKLIYVDDGILSLLVLSIDGTDVHVRAVNNGTLSSRKGVNLPKTPVDLPALSEKDKKDLQFGVKNGVDMIFASFIRRAQDVVDIREVLGPDGASIKIIVKIENEQGVENFDEILREADGVMVARGDLGIEIPASQVFIAQKMMIAKCNIAGKPVICATQMLESMTYNPRPTRAEVSDVANAVLDGADCVMLSGETAKGSYPIQSVLMMAETCFLAESTICYPPLFDELRAVTPRPTETAETIGMAAVAAASEQGASAILVLSTSGNTARLISKYRPSVPIITVTRNIQTARQIHLHRGCYPFWYPEPRGIEASQWQRDVDNRIRFGLRSALNLKIIRTGTTVIAVQGWKGGLGHTNTLRILSVPTDPADLESVPLAVPVGSAATSGVATWATAWATSGMVGSGDPPLSVTWGLEAKHVEGLSVLQRQHRDILSDNDRAHGPLCLLIFLYIIHTYCALDALHRNLPGLVSVYLMPHRDGKPRLSPLPSYTNAMEEKHHLTSRTSAWTTTFYIPLPFRPSHRLKLVLPIPQRVWSVTSSRMSRRRAFAVLCFIFLTLIWVSFAFHKRYVGKQKAWPKPIPDKPPTLVFRKTELQKIWDWEIASGHYPSNRPIPSVLGLTIPPPNPGLPAVDTKNGNRLKPPGGRATYSVGTGPSRKYVTIKSEPPNAHYPPRPTPGGIADLDIIMDHCDFSANKYVRDCLELMRIGTGIDGEKRLRRTDLDRYNFIYVEDKASTTPPAQKQVQPSAMHSIDPDDPDAGLVFNRRGEFEPALKLPPPRLRKASGDACDPNHPRIYHMFWTGEFTDKPYMALMSYLFTQNLGLGEKRGAPTPAGLCRPEFWMWINPGPAAAVPNPSAFRDMYEGLKLSPWASPFLHERFQDVIKFKMWNTTEQLDSIPEIKDEWREFEATLFNSGGVVYEVKKAAGANDTNAQKGVLGRVGSDSAQNYDRMSTILSDMARFILCHRFGGTYLDADTILLRDWEELWGWPGAFAYRWSRLEEYNTAVLRLNKGSALGTFLFRTAFRNGLDFHPMTVWRYMRDAHLQGLLLRLPDALFDSAWLNTEDYQRDRPAFPFFTDFQQFFEPKKVDAAAPNVLGFDGFFRGAWLPFDKVRNYPDLGERFRAGEQRAKDNLLRKAKALAKSAGDDPNHLNLEFQQVDPADLSWATVLKRTFEAYIRGERPNMYGEWIKW